MAEKRTAGRWRAVLAVVFGLVAFVTGVSVRLFAMAEQASLRGDPELAWTAAALTALALVGAAAARPTVHRGELIAPWVAAGVLAAAMILLSLVDPALRSVFAPAALETAGGIALLIAAVRWSEATTAAQPRSSTVAAGAKFELYRGQTSSLVPASALVANDEVRLEAGDVVPVDGFIASTRGRLDESPVFGPRPATERGERSVVFAGTRAESPIRVVAAAPLSTSWTAQRDARHAALTDQEISPDRMGRRIAQALSLIAFGVAGMAMTQAGPLAVAVWAPTAAAVLIAAAAAAPSMGRIRGRLDFLNGLHRHGVVVTRSQDLRALMQVEQWHIDANLLAGSGSVETVALADDPPETIVRVAEALLREHGGLVHRSVRHAIERMALVPAEGAALRQADGLYWGTVEGRRWFTGTAEAVHAKRGDELDPARKTTFSFWEDHGQTPWVVGLDAEGPVGIMGIGFEVRAEVQAAARALDAVVTPSAEAEQVAARADLPLAASPPGQHHGTLTAASTLPPKVGVRLRVLTPEPGPRLPAAGSPRLMAPSLPLFAERWPALRADLLRAPRSAAVAAGAVLTLVSSIALTAGMAPVFGVLAALIAVGAAVGSRLGL